MIKNLNKFLKLTTRNSILDIHKQLRIDRYFYKIHNQLFYNKENKQGTLSKEEGKQYILNYIYIPNSFT